MYEVFTYMSDIYTTEIICFNFFVVLLIRKLGCNKHNISPILDESENNIEDDVDSDAEHHSEHDLNSLLHLYMFHII